MPRSEDQYDSRPPRRMSVDSDRSRERDELDEPVPAKRMRTDTRTEDKARSKRLFGNLLGTLQKFQKDDKSSRKTEKAKRREEVAERIQAKIRTETTLHHDIAESERELKTLRIQTESLEYILKHKVVAMSARHATLRPISRFLHTSLPTASTPLFEGNLLNPSPIPLNQGPTRQPPHPDDLKPLYFLPKVLLEQQQDALNSRIANVEELVMDEQEALDKEKEEVAETARKNRARIAELGEKLADLKSQVKPAAARGDTDELGRMPREEMDLDREAGVQITGEDGDVEVEY